MGRLVINDSVLLFHVMRMYALYYVQADFTLSIFHYPKYTFVTQFGHFKYSLLEERNQSY